VLCAPVARLPPVRRRHAYPGVSIAETAPVRRMLTQSGEPAHPGIGRRGCARLAAHPICDERRSLRNQTAMPWRNRQECVFAEEVQG
jgi:hypothetical protein